MKKILAAVILVMACLGIAACNHTDASTPAQTTPPITTGTTAVQPTTTVPTTVPETTAPPILTGWQVQDGHTYYFLDGGIAATGWQDLAEGRYYFGADGVLRTDWQDLAEGRFYFGPDGILRTGWQDLEEGRFYFGADGVMVTGWQTDEEGVRRYFGTDGVMAKGWRDVDGSRYFFEGSGKVYTGWLELDGKRYYLDENGVMVTGWLLQGEKRYYLQENGVMARGCVQIDGVNTYFTSTGDYILLVNPWNYLPEGYEPNLVSLDRYNGYNNMLIAECCYDALVQMLRDCKNECQIAYVVSSYRTQEFQEKNYQRKVNYYLNLGYSQADAEVLAAKVVAVPGTSEHQSGLAVDIVDGKLWLLEDEQADMPAQKWLMEHCWEYGFILRYPKDKTDVTGIIYEPWHYRYVGLELAAELHELGLTLEEYLDALTAEQS